MPVSELLSSVPVGACAYLVVYAVAALDVYLPVLPSEGTVAAAGVLAAAGRLNLALVVAAAMAGAMTGDFTCYRLGRRRPRGAAAVVRRASTQRVRIRVMAAMTHHAGPVLVVARFLPGGRTAATFAAGRAGLPQGRYLAWIGVAAALWATLGAGAGYLGGQLPISRLIGGAALILLAVGGTAVGVQVHR
ncbi:MAG TPA: VTT domain-containing protein, partial [Pilimelia sp.]|nr:VTT domain-containing protein [Pilimelia sp.]